MIVMAIITFSDELPIIALYSADTVGNKNKTENVHNNLHPTEF